jgi:hypothetical protein
MGIGFEIFLYSILIALCVVIYVFLTFLKQAIPKTKVFRDGFVVFVVVAVVFQATVLSLAIGAHILENIYPERIFARMFGASPAPEIKDVKGESKFIGYYGFDEVVLEFKTSRAEIDLLIDKKLFVERSRESFLKSKDEKLRQFATRPSARVYISSSFKENCNEEMKICVAFLAYDEESQETYFVN